jgi:hypothetical protein
MDIAAVYLILKNHPFRTQANSIAEREPVVDAIIVRAAAVSNVEIITRAVGTLPRSYKMQNFRMPL